LVGVKVTLSESVPVAGTVLGAVQANVPGTDAVPPVSVDAESACPLVIALAVGTAEMVGVVFAAAFTTIFTLAVAVL
jgi:hypothetical protein